MALNCTELINISMLLKGKNNPQILSLGYPDLLITKEQTEQYFGINPSALKVRADSTNVAKTHGTPILENWCVDSYSFFKMLGGELTVFDYNEWTGDEIIVDMNHPIDMKYKNKFDLVIDPGTTEHIFNIAEAMKNILFVAKEDGYVYHQTPLCHINHGFYNFSPTFYADFYEQNGCFIVDMFRFGEHTDRYGFMNTRYPLDKFSIIDMYEQKAHQCVIVKKLKEVDRVEYPIQTLYSGRHKDDLDKNALMLLANCVSDGKLIACVPFGVNAKFFGEQVGEKQIVFFDEGEEVVRQGFAKSLREINAVQFDKIVIVSSRYCDVIKKKVIDMGVDEALIVTINDAACGRKIANI